LVVGVAKQKSKIIHSKYLCIQRLGFHDNFVLIGLLAFLVNAGPPIGHLATQLRNVSTLKVVYSPRPSSPFF